MTDPTPPADRGVPEAELAAEPPAPPAEEPFAEPPAHPAASRPSGSRWSGSRWRRPGRTSLVVFGVALLLGCLLGAGAMGVAAVARGGLGHGDDRGYGDDRGDGDDRGYGDDRGHGAPERGDNVRGRPRDRSGPAATPTLTPAAPTPSPTAPATTSPSPTS